MKKPGYPLLLCADRHGMSRQKTATTTEKKKKACTFNGPKNAIRGQFINRSHKVLLYVRYCSRRLRHVSEQKQKFPAPTTLCPSITMSG